MIGSIEVLRDRFLVVTHARLSSAPVEFFQQVHHALDVYDLLEERKILEDIDLPDGARVLAGGRYLYVLTAEPPEPWTILRLSLREG